MVVGVGEEFFCVGFVFLGGGGLVCFLGVGFHNHTQKKKKTKKTKNVVLFRLNQAGIDERAAESEGRTHGRQRGALGPQ